MDLHVSDKALIYAVGIVGVMQILLMIIKWLTE
jgi:hypothetical protein